MEYTPQDSCTQLPCQTPRTGLWRRAKGQDAAFRLLGYCETESSLAMHGVMQFARAVLSCKMDTPKVSTKWLGCVWKSSRTDWELRCWIDYVAG